MREAAAAGLTASAAVIAELMTAGVLEVGSPWAPLNAIAPVLFPGVEDVREWHRVITPTGLAVTAAGVAGWGGLSQLVQHRLRAHPAAVWVAPLSGLALALFDYRVLPPARRPRLTRWLSPLAVFGKYAALSAALALASAPRSGSDR